MLDKMPGPDNQPQEFITPSLNTFVPSISSEE